MMFSLPANVTQWRNMGPLGSKPPERRYGIAWRNAHALAQALASDDLLEVDQRQFKGALGGAL